MKRPYKIFLLTLLFAGALGFFVFLFQVAGTSVLNPKGLIASQERDLIVFATLLMLTVVVPVFFLTGFFAWKYRASNKKAKYTPDWEHSRVDELIWWAVPFVLIAILAAVTWRTTHDLDPFRALGVDAKPVVVQVVALDWKWLFIYPEEGIASVNHFEIPIYTPVNFEISADAPMNSFWLPQLGGQIYAMPGMRTKLHLFADAEGVYNGSSANLSGKGFSGMDFTAQVGTQEDFDAWVAEVKRTGQRLDWSAYTQLTEPTINHPTILYGAVDTGLFERILMKFMMPGMNSDTTKNASMNGHTH